MIILYFEIFFSREFPKFLPLYPTLTNLYGGPSCMYCM